jgi:putative DNA primase/helicase
MESHSNPVSRWPEISDAVTQFTDVIDAAGLGRPDVIADGDLHRFKTPDDRIGARSGWYKLHLDGIPAGTFGDWRSGIKMAWKADIDIRLTKEQRHEIRRQVEHRRRERRCNERAQQARAAQLARTLWQISPPALFHPYLRSKGVLHFGTRVCTVDTWREPFNLRPDLPEERRPNYRGWLLVPVTFERRVRSLQFIGAKGTKRFLFGGRIKGGYYPVSSRASRPGRVYVCEGFATAASVHQITRYPAVAAFNAGNLTAVAMRLRGRFPDLHLVIAGDNDTETERRTGRNPGKEAAYQAAGLVGADVVFPDFGRAAA